MKRNFGSLNLAALGANSAECSLADQFSAMNPSAEDYTMEVSVSEYSSDKNVGLSLERLDKLQSAFLDEDMYLSDTVPELMLNPRSRSSIHPPMKTAETRSSHVIFPSVSDLQQHHDQHRVDALRCLSLKVMLSNLSTSDPSNSVNGPLSPTKPSCSYPGVNVHTKTALLPIRNPSLQSV